MIERICVTCGEELYRFKLGSSARSVLDTLARMHPPRGCLQHVDDVALVALSQERLSQNNYTYRPGQATEDVVDECVMDAVHRLQLKKGKEFETCGTAVVCTSTGLCVTADHCLDDLPRRPKLFVGGLPAKICARSGKKDIAALKVDGNNELQFIPLDGTLLMKKTMKVHLISYPVMVDADFAGMGPTFTYA